MSRLLYSSLRLSSWIAIVLLAGCGGSSGSSQTGSTTQQAVAPVITTAAAQNNAQIVTLATSTSGATIYYTLDGSAPTTSSSIYEAPFLIASNVTLKALASKTGYTASTISSQTFTPNIPSGTMVWSDEFTNSTSSNAQPDPAIWTYDTGAGGWGNNELENYCAWNGSAFPCSTDNPNAYIGADGYLHIVARESSPGVFTSARLKTQGLFSFQYGRIEVRAQVPEQQGLWPAFWLLGNNITAVSWPACGEQDVLERVNAATTPDWNEGSIHGTGFTGTSIGTRFSFPTGQTAAQWHTYGMIWSKGAVSYYIDDPSSPYVTYTTADLAGHNGAVWPFDSGANFLLINLAVGGDWPGSPDATTSFPAQMLVDYVRIYTN
ncbi:MAG TPA: family 16 glycosylhydrolase [Terracidiphilus sp.]|nr:family 16 glycosylhydrolase [Terracidiphilus sp.]